MVTAGVPLFVCDGYGRLAGGTAPCAAGQAMAVATAGTRTYSFCWLVGGSGAVGPPGERKRSATTASAYRPDSSSVSCRYPSAVMVRTRGKVGGVSSVPPVGESWSAASYWACLHIAIAATTD